MPRKKEGLGPAFSCRLREDQDQALRNAAAEQGKPLVTVLRGWLDRLDALEKLVSVCEKRGVTVATDK